MIFKVESSYGMIISNITMTRFIVARFSLIRKIAEVEENTDYILLFREQTRARVQ